MAFLARAPAAAGAAGHQHPRRPGAAAGPAARPRRAHRGPRGRPPVHPRRGGRLPRRRHRARRWTRTTSRRSRPGPRAGSRPSSSPRSRCGTATTRRAFIAGFAGDDRYVVDYLVEEVLDRQPDEVRDFLLGTAILDRLTGPLCDAVTETPRAAARCSSRWSGGTCSWCRSTTSAAGTATTTCSPTSSARTCSPSSPSGSPGCTAGPASGTHDAGETLEPAVRHALAAGDVERAADAGRARDPGAAPRTPGGGDPGLGRRPAGRGASGNRPVLAIGLVGGLMSSNEFDGRRGAAATTSSGSSRCPRTSWSWWTATSSRGSRRPIEMYRAALALNARRPGRHHRPRRPRARARGRGRRPDRGRRPRRCPAWRPGAMGDLEAAHARLHGRRGRGWSRAGHIADVLRLHDHARRPRARPWAGSARRERTLRARPRARRERRADPPCAAPPTCTSA